MLSIYAIIGIILYFLLILGIISYQSTRYSAEDFFFANRTMPYWLLAITFVASWWGAGSALATADLAYTKGMSAFLYFGGPVLLSAFLLILGAKTIRQIPYLTQGKMMQARYSEPVAYMVSLMNLIFMIFNIAVQMVGIGMFFGAYLHISYEIAILVGTLIVLFYSWFGGFRAVVLTDLIQFFFLTVSAIIVAAYALYYAGGWDAIAQTAQAHNYVGYMDITHDFSSYIVYIFTFGASWMIQANVWQRVSAAKNVKEAKKMAAISFFAYIPLYLIVVVTGMAALVLFKAMPEGGIVPAVVMGYMPPAMGALVFVGIAAAIMSTMDSLINTGAMTAVLDLGFGKNSGRPVLYSRWATIIVTIVAVIISIKIRTILEVAWIASDVITTGVFVPLVLGFFWKRGNSKGALTSMIAGLLYCFYNLAITLGASLPHFWTHGAVSQALVGIGLSFVLYVGMSLCTKEEYDKSEPFIAAARGVKV